MSSHVCPTFKFNFSQVQKHPDADRLGIFKIPETEYTYILNLEDWKNRDGILVSWVIPDSLVDTRRPEFDFLIDEAKYDENSQSGGFYHRVKARRLRGLVSYGLLVPTPEGIKEGEDAAEVLGVVHYEKPEGEFLEVGTKKVKLGGGEDASAPNQYCPDYDLENFQKVATRMFTDKETVICTEKINGENFRVLFDGNKLNVGSHHKWKKEFSTAPNFTVESLVAQEVPQERAEKLYLDKVVNFKPVQNTWWEVVRQNPEIEKFCRANPGFCIYGEKTKKHKKMTYNLKDGEFKFFAFDILTPEGKWMNYDDAKKLAEPFGIQWVPEVYRGEFDIDKLIEVANRKTVVNKATHIAEGVVVQPEIERSHERLGRAKVKIISVKYFEGDYE